MSYGMHDYLADKAQQRYTYMQKKAASKKPWEADPDPGEPTNTGIDKGHWAEVNKKRGVKEPSWLQSRMADARDVYALGKAKAGEYYSRARAFVAKHPEILYGLGGAAAGAGIGALVSPKRRLLGSLLGLGIGGALGYGGKLAWDRYGRNITDVIPGSVGASIRQAAYPENEGLTTRDADAARAARNYLDSVGIEQTNGLPSVGNPATWRNKSH